MPGRKIKQLSLAYLMTLTPFLTEDSVGRDYSNLESIYRAVREETKKGDVIAVEMTPWELEEFRICGRILRHGIPKNFSLPKKMPLRNRANVEHFIEQYKKWGRKDLIKLLPGNTLFFISLTRFLDLRGHEILPIDRQLRRKAYLPIMLEHGSYKQRIAGEKNEERKRQLIKEHRLLLGKAFYPSIILGNISMARKIKKLKEKGKRPRAVLVGSGHAYHLARELVKVGIDARARYADRSREAEMRELAAEMEEVALEYAAAREREKKSRAKTRNRTEKRKKGIFLTKRRI